MTQRSTERIALGVGRDNNLETAREHGETTDLWLDYIEHDCDHLRFS